MPPRSFRRALAGCALLACALPPHSAGAQARRGDPFAYDLRAAVFPLSFQAGVSQGSFGSAARIEYGLARALDLHALGRLSFWNVTGERTRHGYSVGGGLALHVVQALQRERLGGTVYPEDTPALRGPGSTGTDSDLRETSVSQRMGGPRMTGDHDPDLDALMRSVYSVRLGFTYTRAVEHWRSGGLVYVENELPLAHAGFGWGTHWNLESNVTGARELGYRRYYVDALATLPSLARWRYFDAPRSEDPPMFALGLRMGMEGSIDALLTSVPGLGFAYSLELGSLPGRAGLEGYLFVGLGVALDAATR